MTKDVSGMAYCLFIIKTRHFHVGCWPDDGKKPYPGPPTNLTTDIVVSNTSGSCAALLHVSWTAPVTGNIKSTLLEYTAPKKVLFFYQLQEKGCTFT